MLQNPGDPPETVLQTGMPKPPTSVRSIRLQNTDWEWLAAEAEKRGTTVNGLVAEGVALVASTAKYTVGRGVAVYSDSSVRATEPSAPIRKAEPKFRGVTASGEPLPHRGAYQKGQRK